MENAYIEEPDRTHQWPVVPCPGCQAIDLDDCQCLENKDENTNE